MRIPHTHRTHTTDTQMYTYSRATVYHIHVLQLLEPIQRREYDRILDMHHRRTSTHRMDPVTARLPPALVPQRPRLEGLAAFEARLPHAAIRGLRLHGGGGHVVLREHTHDEGIALVHLRKREGRRYIYNQRWEGGKLIYCLDDRTSTCEVGSFPLGHAVFVHDCRVIHVA